MRPAAAAALGTKLNIPLPPGADDAAFARDLAGRCMAHLERAEPEFIILQCGADSLGGDPLAHLQLTAGEPPAGRDQSRAGWPTPGPRAPAGAGRRRLQPANIAAGWNAVLEALLEA